MTKKNNLKLQANDLQYMAFEGGGGKGVAFLGVIQALEEDIKVGGKSILPLPIDDNTKQIKGISGSSAGAITALMLAMGYSSKDILKEINTYNFDKFFDPPKPGEYRRVDIYGIPKIITTTHKPEFVKARITSVKNTIDTIKNIANLLKYPAIIAAGLKLDKMDEESITKLADTFYEIKTEIEKSPIYKQLSNKKYLPGYINNILYEKGMFPGFEVRKYFQDLIYKNFKDKYKEYKGAGMHGARNKTEYKERVASWVDFYTFHGLTGIDLKFVGANVSKKRSLIFSRQTTPDFPVCEAVGISMNLPFLFKPIFVADASRSDSNSIYRGWYVDGGLLNNLPLHAFDDLDTGDVNRNIIAFRLTPEAKNKKVYPPNKESRENVGIDELLEHLGDVMGSLMEQSEEREIQSNMDLERSIDLYTYGLKTTVFSPSEEVRKKPIDEAREAVKNYFKQTKDGK